MGFWIVVLIIAIYIREKAQKKDRVAKKADKPKEQRELAPYPDILKIIRLYNELSDKNCSVDKCERIRRCDELLTEYEWHQCHKDVDAWYPNVLAIWHAVCDNDVRYEGTRYPQYTLMTDICLSIQSKYSNVL